MQAFIPLGLGPNSFFHYYISLKNCCNFLFLSVSSLSNKNSTCMSPSTPTHTHTQKVSTYLSVFVYKNHEFILITPILILSHKVYSSLSPFLFVTPFSASEKSYILCILYLYVLKLIIHIK